MAFLQWSVRERAEILQRFDGQINSNCGFRRHRQPPYIGKDRVQFYNCWFKLAHPESDAHSDAAVFAGYGFFWAARHLIAGESCKAQREKLRKRNSSINHFESDENRIAAVSTRRPKRFPCLKTFDSANDEGDGLVQPNRSDHDFEIAAFTLPQSRSGNTATAANEAGVLCSCTRVWPTLNEPLFCAS